MTTHILVTSGTVRRWYSKRVGDVIFVYETREVDGRKVYITTDGPVPAGIWEEDAVDIDELMKVINTSDNEDLKRKMHNFLWRER